MHKNRGLLNEDKMIKMINEKTIDEMNKNIAFFLEEMYGLVDKDIIFHAQKIEGFIKPDFEIEYLGELHFVSMKSGRATTVHQESIKSFILFLRQFGISKRTQKTLLLYQYGDGTMDGTGEKRLGYTDIRYKLKNEIEEANIELNSNYELITAFANRILFVGTDETNQSADYIYHGTYKLGTFASKRQINKWLRRKTYAYIEALHIGPFLFRPHARYADTTIKDEESRHKVDIYWPTIQSDLDYIQEKYDG